jgi:hypothetical protein
MGPVNADVVDAENTVCFERNSTCLFEFFDVRGTFSKIAISMTDFKLFSQR